jgi:hypothetical protein
VRTIEKRVQVVVIGFAEFEKVLARLWTCLDFEVYDEVAERRLKQDRHSVLGKRSPQAGDYYSMTSNW